MNPSTTSRSGNPSRVHDTLRRLVRRAGLLLAYPALWVCDVGLAICDYDMEPLSDVRRRSRAAWLKAWRTHAPNNAVTGSEASP